MDFGPIGEAVGVLGLAGAVILALLKYLTSDLGGTYRDLIAELRSDNTELRKDVDLLKGRLLETEERETQLLLQIRRLHGLIDDTGTAEP